VAIRIAVPVVARATPASLVSKTIPARMISAGQKLF
jgi:hypothetical protein